jgi:UDPglucose--hexose-1-phosphate uridylyltransferase
VIERHSITGDAILIVPERADRPNIFREGDRCPFCPGHESDTPPEIWRDGDPWHIRIFPNKYPATERHEIIVESPQHAATFDQLMPQHASLAVEGYINRYRSLAAQAEYVCIFKNHGILGGASIPHLHSQILATPFVPPRIAREANAFTQSCPLCALEGPLIEETTNYRWIAPPGSSMAYEQWIIPKHHAPEMTDPRELAMILQRSTRAMLSIADSFNWIFMNFPRHPPAHWYVQLFPRLTMHAGFELGTGSAINTVDPAETARRFARSS